MSGKNQAPRFTQLESQDHDFDDIICEIFEPTASIRAKIGTKFNSTSKLAVVRAVKFF